MVSSGLLNISELIGDVNSRVMCTFNFINFVKQNKCSLKSVIWSHSKKSLLWFSVISHVKQHRVCDRASRAVPLQITLSVSLFVRPSFA